MIYSNRRFAHQPLALQARINALRQLTQKHLVDVPTLAILHFGEPNQMQKAIQELAEAITELSKHLEGRDNENELIEEVVDAAIMIDQLWLMFPADDLSETYLWKLDRLRQRIQDDMVQKEAHENQP